MERHVLVFVLLYAASYSMPPPSVDREGQAPPLSEASTSDAGPEEAAEGVGEVAEEVGAGEGGEEDMEIDEVEVEERVEKKDEHEGERKEGGGGEGGAQGSENGMYSLDHCKCSSLRLLLIIHYSLSRVFRIVMLRMKIGG